MAGLNKKLPATASKELAYAMEKLSKAALIDLCLDMLRRMEGADTSDENLAERLDSFYLPAVFRIRGDRLPGVAKALNHYIAASRKYEAERQSYNDLAASGGIVDAP